MNSPLSSVPPFWDAWSTIVRAHFLSFGRSDSSIVGILLVVLEIKNRTDISVDHVLIPDASVMSETRLSLM